MYITLNIFLVAFYLIYIVDYLFIVHYSQNYTQLC